MVTVDQIREVISPIVENTNLTNAEKQKAITEQIDSYRTLNDPAYEYYLRGGVARIIDTNYNKEYYLKRHERMVEEKREVERCSISESIQFYYDNTTEMLSHITEINVDGRFSYDIQNIKKIFVENKAIYESISEKTNVPTELIAALHYRESGADFNTYLHNGQELGTETTIVPKGRIFYDFKEAAVDALLSEQKGKGFYFTEEPSMEMMMTFAEVYNGVGYTDYHDMATPYVYSGTNLYTKGKYVADSKFNSEAVDKQPGVYILVWSLLQEDE